MKQTKLNKQNLGADVGDSEWIVIGGDRYWIKKEKFKKYKKYAPFLIQDLKLWDGSKFRIHKENK